MHTLNNTSSYTLKQKFFMLQNIAYKICNNVIIFIVAIEYVSFEYGPPVSKHQFSAFWYNV